jgi:type I restriction enzyme S subunit
MEIPMPTINQQKKAIPIFQKVDAMKPLREGALKELDAMLPSILDKAFKGEL